MIVYGIKNCNTVKAAIEWLKKNQLAFEFHDYKTKGITESKLRQWTAQVGWESLLNKRGTTWRQLPSDVQTKITTKESAIALMKEKTSVIKRPILEKENVIQLIGFDEGDNQKWLVKNENNNP